MTVNEAVAVLLRQILEKLNMSKERAAVLSNVPFETMNNLLLGKDEANDLTLIVKICRALGIPIGLLFCDKVFNSDTLIIE